MFFDSLGHNGKDLVILALIVFTFVLSIFIIMLNNSVNWWDKKCNLATISEEDRKKHGNSALAVTFAGIFVGVVCLIILYSGYMYFKKGKVVGVSQYGRR
jgi:hypothetical protein